VIGRLGGERRTVSQCGLRSGASTALPCDDSPESDWSVYDWGQEPPPRRPEWAKCSRELHSTIVAVAEKSFDETPDVPVAFLLAERIATPDHQVSVIIVPPYLEADYALEDSLRSARTEVEGGVIVGGPIRIPDDTRLKVRSILVPRSSTAWVERLEKGLEPLEALLLALLTLFGVRQIPSVAPLLEGAAKAVHRWREKRPKSPKEIKFVPPEQTRAKEGGSVSETQGRRRPWRTAREPSTLHQTEEPWERWKLRGVRVRVTLEGDTTWTGLVEEPPEIVAGVPFIALRDAESSDPATPSPSPGQGEPRQRLALVLIRWEGVRQLSRGPVPPAGEGKQGATI